MGVTNCLLSGMILQVDDDACILKNSRAFWQIYMSKAFAWIQCCTPPEHYDGVAAAWCWRRAIQKGSCKFLDFHTPAGGGKWMLECWREQQPPKKQLWIHLASNFFSARCGKLLVIVKKTLWCRNEDSVVATLNSQHQLGEFKQGDLFFTLPKLNSFFPWKVTQTPIGT